MARKKDSPPDPRGLATRLEIVKYDKGNLQKEVEALRRDKQDLEGRLVLALRCLSVMEKLTESVLIALKQGKALSALLMIAPYLALAGVVPYLLSRGMA